MLDLILFEVSKSRNHRARRAPENYPKNGTETRQIDHLCNFYGY